MKRSKKRDPAKEPFASPISDDERGVIVKRVLVGDKAATEMFNAELARANDKVSAALNQWKGNLAEDIRFVDAEASASSAQGTYSSMISAATELVWVGAKTRRNARKAGRARHDSFSYESERREGWEKLRRSILREWAGPGHKLTQRGLAKLIADRDPGKPKWESVRSYLKTLRDPVGQQRR